jgi:DNA polymerase bacteriophage-type
MLPKAHLDYETGSPEELTGKNSVGVHRYFENPHTRTWGFRYRIGDGPVNQWRPGWPDPWDLLTHIMLGGIVVAHNAMFERISWRTFKARLNLDHWPNLPAEQQECTLARAAAKSLPMSLEQLSEVLALKQRKDMAGHAVMLKMAKPKITKDGSMVWNDDPVLWDRNMQYCGQDVLTECEADEVLPPLSEHEQKLWVLDQKINDRGIPLDMEFVTRAVDLVEYGKAQYKQKIKELTGGAITSYTQVGKIVEWIKARGIACESFKKGDHDDIMIVADTRGDKVVRQVVELRQAAGKTSTAKYAKMQMCVCADGRGRGVYQYHGAGPGRWAGRLWQAQNLFRVDEKLDAPIIDYTLTCVMSRATLATIYKALAVVGDPLVMLAKCMRSSIKAEPGNKLIGGDFANIEGRVNAFLSGEQWKLDAYRAYDEGTGPDLYKVSYSRSFGVPVESIGNESRERQIGKVEELFLGFQGGVGAFLSAALNYNIDLTDLVQPVRTATPTETWDKIAATYPSATDKRGLPEDQWTAIKTIVTGWRDAHPKIKASWWDLQDAALNAVDNPNCVYPVYNERARYLSDGNFLYCQLPSGRVICYAQPHIRHTKEEHVEINGLWYNVDQFEPWEIEHFKSLNLKFRMRGRNTVWYWEVNGTTKQWNTNYLYGGTQAENIIQATARCALDRAMFKVEAAGYPIIFHAHDEIMSEVLKTFGSVKDYEKLMTVDEPWLEGMPFAVKGWEGQRYG